MRGINSLVSVGLVATQALGMMPLGDVRRRQSLVNRLHLFSMALLQSKSFPA
jgi:hypothetical protein